jgi:hypothetical protein
LNHYISHRGNLNGPNKSLENRPDYILNALNKGFECEVDLWYVRKQLYLGHDEAQYPIHLEFLLRHSEKLWVHCKNPQALIWCLECPELNSFWHEHDTVTLTSKNFIWAYPGRQPIIKSIAVMPELNSETELKQCLGICSDYIMKYNRNYENIFT